MLALDRRCWTTGAGITPSEAIQFLLDGFFWRAAGSEQQDAQHLRAIANRDGCGEHASR
jgi:hypothetical protein